MASTGGSSGKVREIVDWLAMSPAASLAAILIVALVCFLPGFMSIAPLDGDEPGYAVAAREMVDTGDYASIRLQTENTIWRPRGAYWIQALVVTLAGGSPPLWVQRLPSLAAAVAAAMLTWWTALAFGRPRAALLAGLFIAASGLVGLEARLATADAILLAATTLSCGALARLWLNREAEHTGLLAGLFWIGLGVAILAKGAVAPAMALAAAIILSLERLEFAWLRRLRASTGVVLLFLIVSPWLIAVALTLLQGPSDGPSADFLDRLGVSFALKAPPGSYLLLLPLLAGPCATFIFIALPWIWTEYRRPIVFFALAWAGPLWIAAELVQTKQPQNVLPAIPAIAMVAAAAIDAGAGRIGGRISWFYSLGPLLWPPLVAIVMPVVFYALEGSIPVAATLAFAVAAVLGPITWVWLRRGDAVGAAALSVVTVIFIYAGFFGAFVPGLSGIRIGERVAATAAKSVPCFGPAYAAAGYPEESIVLALGARTRIVDPWAAADFLSTSGCRVAAIDASQVSSFRQRADDLGISVVDHGHVAGFNLRKMRTVDVHLFTAGRSTE